MADDEDIAYIAENLSDALKESAEKSAESAEKSADNKLGAYELSKRQKQILTCVKQGKSYSTELFCSKKFRA